MVIPPSTACVYTLPCKMLITTLFISSCIKQSIFYFASNNCQFVSKFNKNDFKDTEFDRMNTTYLQVTDRPNCGPEANAMVADVVPGVDTVSYTHLTLPTKRIV